VCFQIFDANNDELVDREETRTMLTSLYTLVGHHDGKEEIDFSQEVSFFVNVLFTADSNNDDVLCFDEFREAALLHPFILKCFNLSGHEKKRKVELKLS
jgi:Ca2+-binding EF-hand superfamily protein